MSFVRKIVDDLVEKKLWPVALVLLVALVAVPVTLGGGGEEAEVPPPAVAAADLSSGLRPAVVAEPAPTTRQDRGGELRDPFRKLYEKKSRSTSATSSAAVAAAGAAAAAAKAAAGTTGGSSPGTGSSPGVTVLPKGSNVDPATVPSLGTPTPTGSTTKTTTTRKLLRSRVDVRFAPDTRDGRRVKDLDRLRFMPSEKRQYLLYMGTLNDFKTAVFLLADNVDASGDGTCRPATGKCETLELEQGETAKVSVDVGAAQPQSWKLELLDVDTVEVKDAAASGTRTSRVGRRALQTARAIAHAVGRVTQADAYKWDSEKRALRRQSAKKALRAAQAAALEAEAQP